MEVPQPRFKESILIQMDTRRLGEEDTVRQWQQGSSSSSCHNRKSHIHLWQIGTGRIPGEQAISTSGYSMQPRFQCWEYKTSELLVVKISGGWHGGRNCQSLRRVCLQDPHGPRCTQTHLLWDSPPKQQPEGCQ